LCRVRFGLWRQTAMDGDDWMASVCGYRCGGEGGGGGGFVSWLGAERWCRRSSWLRGDGEK
jgi:hypothetical protein